MKRIAANLTPLLTSPAFLLWHLLGAVVCIPAILCAWSSADPGDGRFAAMIVLPGWSAFVLTSLQRELRVKPLVFCLPGYRSVLRRTSFLVGIIVSLAASLPVLTYSELGGRDLWLAMWSACCFWMIAYLFVVGTLFAVNSVVLSIPVLLNGGAVLLGFATAREFVAETALFTPAANSVVVVGLSVFAWRRMGNVELARRACGGRFLGLQMVWRRSAGEEFGQRGKLEALSKGTWSVRRRLLQGCFARISHRPALSFRRHLAATQYELAGRLLPLTPWAWLVTVLLVLVFLAAVGYAPPREDRPDIAMANAAYIGICLLCFYVLIPVFTPLLLPAGRRERFWSALAIAACSGLVVLATSLLLYFFLRGLSSSAPSLTIGGETRIFRPADLGPAFVPFALLPLIIILKIVCQRWLFVPEIMLFVTAILLLVKGSGFVRDLGPTSIAVVLAITWAIFVAVLYSYSFHRDLVRQ